MLAQVGVVNELQSAFDIALLFLLFLTNTRSVHASSETQSFLIKAQSFELFFKFPAVALLRLTDQQ